MNLKNTMLWAAGLLLLGFFIWGLWYIFYIRPFAFKTYTYRVPDQTLIVATEGSATGKIVSTVLAKAFPDYDIVFSNDKPPHLIIKTPDGRKTTSKWDAPYIFWSGERYGIRRNRANGPPFAEILSRTPLKANQFYFPFVLQRDISLPMVRKYTGGKRENFAAYINSNCMEVRETFFKKLKEYNKDAKALGKCSNLTGERPSGGYNDLAKIYKTFRFGFAMENHSVPGYITEKIINVFEGGAIPIFWGDSEAARALFNPEAYIDLKDFKDFNQAIKYIDYLENHPKQLEHMQNAPVFRQHVIPELFLLKEKPSPKYLQECADFIRREYFKAVLG